MSRATRQANPPSATITRTSALTSRHSASSHGAHVARSSGVGALSGGAHRTAATTRVSLSGNPSAASTLSAEFARPARCSAANRKSPTAVAGEHPAGPVGAVRGGRQTDDQDPRRAPTRNRAPACPSRARRRRTGASRRRPRSRQSTSRGHARHTLTSASRSSTDRDAPRHRRAPAPASSPPGCPAAPDPPASRSRRAPASRRARPCAGCGERHPSTVHVRPKPFADRAGPLLDSSRDIP